jgi:SAM-dependent methyltransferase
MLGWTSAAEHETQVARPRQPPRPGAPGSESWPESRTKLPLAEASVDAAVASLVLCSVPDQRRALAEIRRVLRPGGELRFYEHVIPRCQPKRLLLQMVDRSGLWPAVAGGCHPARDTTEAIMRAGFDIEEIERFAFSAQRFEPLIPHILGSARRA